MKILYRYIIKKFFGPFVLTFLFALFILLMQYLWKYVDDLVGKGLEIRIILELLFYASATFVSTACPLAILLSSLMTFGGMGERYEIIAVKSAGIPISKLFSSLLLIVFMLSGFTFWFSNNVSPKAFLKMRTLLFDIKDQKPALNIEEGVFYTGFDNFVIRVGKKGSDNRTIEDVIIYDHSKSQGNTTVTYAKSGAMGVTEDKHYMLFTLNDGFFWDESKSRNNSDYSHPLMRAEFKQQYKRFDLSSFKFEKSDDDFFKSSNQVLQIKELKANIDTLKHKIIHSEQSASSAFLGYLFFFNNLVLKDTACEQYKNLPVTYKLENLPVQKQADIMNYAQMGAGTFINSVNFYYDDVKYKHLSLWSYQIELHRKFTLAVACILFFFIGAPLGSIIRKGGIGIPLVITVLFFTFYFIISIIGEKIAKGDYIPVAMGMWLSTVILIPICIFLSYKATIDSSLFSMDEYTKWFKKIKNFRLFSKK